MYNTLFKKENFDALEGWCPGWLSTPLLLGAGHGGRVYMLLMIDQ